MGQPVWEKITPNGKPFGYQSESEIEANNEIEELKKEIEILKKENEQLREMIESE